MAAPAAAATDDAIILPNTAGVGGPDPMLPEGVTVPEVAPARNQILILIIKYLKNLACEVMN